MSVLFSIQTRLLFFIAGLSFAYLPAHASLSYSTVEETNISIPSSSLGRAFLKHLHDHYAISEDLEVNEYIRNLGHRIAEQTDETTQFTFFVIEDDSINAFAGPDGIIGIHTGLITAAKSEAELASVIAHEIAHITQNHLYRRFSQQTKATWPQMAAMLAAILVGSQNPNAGMAIFSSSQAWLIEKQLKYSRLHEYEADHIGMQYLSKSGYNPKAMPNFFQTLYLKHQNNSGYFPEILRTHPLTEERLAKALDRAEQLKTSQSIKTSHLQLIQARLQNSKTPDSETHSYNAETSCYAQSTKLVDQKKKADQLCIQQQLNLNPNNFLWHSLAIQNSDYDSIKQNQKNQFASTLFPQNSAIQIRWAENLHRQDRTDEAIKTLNEKINNLHYNTYAHALLSKLFAEEKQMANAFYHLAVAQVQRGHIAQSQIHIQKSKQLIKKNTKQKKLKLKVEQLEAKLSKLLKENTNK